MGRTFSNTLKFKVGEMKVSTIHFLLFSMLVCIISAKIIYEENFDKFDKSDWILEVLASPYNNELEYYTGRSKNVRVEDGHLIITPLKENYGGRQYTSARMHSSFHWKYGRVEVRAKLPNGYGLWPAIWLMPEDSVYGGWPASGEIDIMEARGQNLDQIASTVHYGTRNPDNTPGTHYHVGSGAVKLDCSIDQYHVYTMDGTPEQITYRLDGKAYYVQDIKNLPNTWMYSSPGQPFDQDFHMILNVAIGGDYLNGPDPDTKWNYPDAEMWVDYVRVYPLEDISTYQCAAKLSTSTQDICYQIKYVCGKDQTWADVSSECSQDLLDCCLDGISCSEGYIIEMANVVFDSYEKQTGVCSFSGYCEMTHVLNDGPFRIDLEKEAECVVKDDGSHKLCGGLTSACYEACENGFNEVTKVRKAADSTRSCCRTNPAQCKYGDLMQATYDVFNKYYQTSPSDTSCTFGGIGYLDGALEPLRCSDGYDN